jgi:broad specificity phosphatase PhoE
LYSSDLQRARQTAEILAGAVGLSVQIDPRLREVDQGDWEGMLFRDIKELYAAEMARRKDDPANARPPGGESLKELALRMAGAADEIAARHPGASPVLIVSHGLSLATLLARARQVSLTRAYDLIPENTNPEIIQWPAPAAQIIHQEQA